MPKKSVAPLWLKLAYTAFVAVLVPVYWLYYGPANFLYFCDMALLLTLAGLWREDKLLISMGACGIVAPQILWVLDFAAHAFGPSDMEPQRWMAPSLWLVTLMSALLAVFWVPSHLVLSKWRGAAAA